MNNLGTQGISYGEGPGRLPEGSPEGFQEGFPECSTESFQEGFPEASPERLLGRLPGRVAGLGVRGISRGRFSFLGVSAHASWGLRLPLHSLDGLGDPKIDDFWLRPAPWLQMPKTLVCEACQAYFLLPNGASGPEVGLPGRIAGGF